MGNREWITPFKKQCFVTLGVVLNMSNFGLVIGYTSILISQLRQPGSDINIDDTTGSWLASIVGLSIVPGNLVCTVIMERYGRRAASIISILPSLSGWLIIAAAESITSLLVARFLQGVSLGIIANIGPILIGEYTSPTNRGAFLSMISVAFCLGTLCAHTLGSYLSWQKSALVFSLLSFSNLIILIYSPESPSWLIYQGRYDESRKIFRWLRGFSEDDELKAMIAADLRVKENNINKKTQSEVESIIAKINYCKATIRKKEFYKPVFLVIHLYIIANWGGSNILSAYIVDIVNTVVNKESDVSLIIISISSQRLVTTLITTYIIKKVERKKLLISGGVLNVLVLVITAVYSYLKVNNLLPYDHMWIGILLLHLHIFSLATGTLTLPMIIAGELFPLEYRNISSTLCILTLTPNIYVVLKTFPFLFTTIGLHGAFGIYALVLTYCLSIIWIFMPETKDRTLQDIENEFRGIIRDVNDVEPLNAREGIK